MKKPLEEVVKTGLESKFRFVQKFKKFVYLLAVSSMVYSCTLSEKEPELELLLNANNQTVRKGDEVSLTLDEKNQSPYVNSYVLNIDYKKDGIIDETLTSENPININRKFEYEGNNAVYGKLISNSGKIYENSLEIKVLPKDSPVLIFSTDANELRKGEYANFKVDGTDKQNNIGWYILSFDFNDDGKIDRTIRSTNPINTNEKFYTPKVRVYACVEDETGLKDEKSQLIELTEDIGFTTNAKTVYSRGEQFLYIAKVTNVNKDGKEVVLNNFDKQSFSYSLFMKENSYPPIFGFNLDQSVEIHFGIGGELSVDSQESSTSFRINEKCYGYLEGLPFRINGPFKLSFDFGASSLNYLGEGEMDWKIRYQLEGEDKTHTIYLNPVEFTVIGG